MEYAALRQAMVETQLIPRGISDQKVLEAFLKIPRHLFTPENIQGAAYDDCALPIGDGQTISQPYMVAVMTEQLDLKGQEKVLEVGTGSGYQAAILSRLCQNVYTIERFKELSQKAQAVINELGYTNVDFIVGDGTKGYPAAAPYDAIVVTAATESVPQALIDQLKAGGRLVIPLGGPFQQILTKITKKGAELIKEESVPCVFVPLIGN